MKSNITKMHGQQNIKILNLCYTVLCVCVCVRALWGPGCWTQWKESNWLWYSFVLCIMERESKYVYHQRFYWNGSFMIIALLHFYAMYFLQICSETWKIVGAEYFASPLVQRMMQRCHLRRMGKIEFRVAWNDRAYTARDKLFRYNLEGGTARGKLRNVSYGEHKL